MSTGATSSIRASGPLPLPRPPPRCCLLVGMLAGGLTVEGAAASSTHSKRTRPIPTVLLGFPAWPVLDLDCGCGYMMRDLEVDLDRPADSINHRSRVLAQQSARDCYHAILDRSIDLERTHDAAESSIGYARTPLTDDEAWLQPQPSHTYAAQSDRPPDAWLVETGAGLSRRVDRSIDRRRRGLLTFPPTRHSKSHHSPEPFRGGPSIPWYEHA